MTFPHNRVHIPGRFVAPANAAERASLRLGSRGRRPWNASAERRPRPRSVRHATTYGRSAVSSATLPWLSATAQRQKCIAFPSQPVVSSALPQRRFPSRTERSPADHSFDSNARAGCRGQVFFHNHVRNPAMTWRRPVTEKPYSKRASSCKKQSSGINSLSSTALACWANLLSPLSLRRSICTGWTGTARSQGKSPCKFSSNASAK